MRRLPLLAIATIAGASLATLASAGELKPGWTATALATETTDCTETLVQGAWENSKREQHADPALPLSPEIRQELAPQIAAMQKVCACAVRAAAERYSKADADATPKDLDRFVADTVANGTCKLEPH